MAKFIASFAPHFLRLLARAARRALARQARAMIADAYARIPRKPDRILMEA